MRRRISASSRIEKWPTWLAIFLWPGRLKRDEMRFDHQLSRHCEERQRRSNPFFLCDAMDCFASLAMTIQLDLISLLGSHVDELAGSGEKQLQDRGIVRLVVGNDQIEGGDFPLHGPGGD